MKGSLSLGAESANFGHGEVEEKFELWRLTHRYDLSTILSPWLSCCSTHSTQGSRHGIDFSSQRVSRCCLSRDLRELTIQCR